MFSDRIQHRVAIPDFIRIGFRSTWIFLASELDPVNVDNPALPHLKGES